MFTIQVKSSILEQNLNDNVKAHHWTSKITNLAWASFKRKRPTSKELEKKEKESQLEESKSQKTYGALGKLFHDEGEKSEPLLQPSTLARDLPSTAENEVLQKNEEKKVEDSRRKIFNFSPIASEAEKGGNNLQNEASQEEEKSDYILQDDDVSRTTLSLLLRSQS